MAPRKIIIPIPNRDFDLSEVALPWQIMRTAGHIVEFATPDGGGPAPTRLCFSGEGLDPGAGFPA